MTRFCTLLLVAALGLGAPAAAQEDEQPQSGRLQTLLAELRGVSEDAWQERVAAMRADAEARRKRAEELRAQAKKLIAEAGALEGQAEALHGEIERLGKLRELLGSMMFQDAAAAEQAAKKAEAAEMAAAKEKAAKEKAAEKKAAEKKAAEKKDADKKAAEQGAKQESSADGDAMAAAAMQAGDAEAAVADDETLYNYDDHLLPVFEEHCTVCHDPFDQEGGLDLSAYEGVVQGGGSGRTLKKGDPAGSRLFLLVSHREKPTMPPKEPRIAADKIAKIRQWIAQGAPENAAEAEKLAAERARRAAEAKERAQAAAGGELPEVMPIDAPGVTKQLPEHAPALRAVATSPTSPLLAVPGHEQVLLMHSGSLAELAVLPFPYGHVTSLAFTADGSRLVAGGGVAGQTGGAVLYDVRSGAELGRFAEQRDQVLAAAPSPDGSFVAAGGTRRRVAVFAADDPAQRLYTVDHDDWVTDLEFSPDGELLASADRKGLVRVTEARTGRDAHELRGHEGAVHAVAFRPDSSLLASAGVDRRVQGWRMRDGERAFSTAQHGAAVLDLAWLGAGKLLSVGADGLLAVADAGGKRLARKRVAADWIYAVAAVRGGDRIVAVDWTATLSSVDADALEVANRLQPLAVEP